MSTNVCSKCGAPQDSYAKKCKYCGSIIESQPEVRNVLKEKYKEFKKPEEEVADKREEAQIPDEPKESKDLNDPKDPNEPQRLKRLEDMSDVPNGHKKSIELHEAWPLRNKALAGLLAFLFGAVGAHKFYLGHYKQGILYIVFLWTGVPPFIGLVEAFIYWFSKPEAFAQKHHVRLY